ncbi:MAG: T9SS type A sorting domain-containing protein [Flavobacteriales bacterium]|nr:T9SS type A sorting domain-containing protein [Flavobacteriales bacterium]
MFFPLRYYLVLLLCFGCRVNHVEAQNLVPNPSFEDTVQCPSNVGQIMYATNWFNPSIGGASTDYFNACADGFSSVPDNKYGDQLARTGNAYAGIVTASDNPSIMGNYREYLHVRLIEPLLEDIIYYVSFYVSLADDCAIYSNEIGTYFSDSSVVQPNMYVLGGLTPQVQNSSSNALDGQSGWQQVIGSFKAIGGEEYLVLGNFIDAIGTALYFAGTGLNYSLYYIDDVCVSTDSVTCYGLVNANKEYNVLTYKVNIFPNPTTGSFDVKSPCIMEIVKIYDLTGKQVFQLQPNSQQIAIDLSQYNEGVYWLVAESKKGKFIQKLIVL